jgi:multidrug efflux pump subunit AcrA (membrane-fusion protein)
MKINSDRIIQITLLALIAAGVLSISLASGSSGTQPDRKQGPPMTEQGGNASQSIVAVETAEVKRQTVSQFIRINGDVVAENTVDLFSDVSGKITSINVKVGDYIHRGDKIAVVDPSLPGKQYSASAVISTINGTVTAINYRRGDTVSTQNAIATIGDLKDLQIDTYIPERYVSAVTPDLVAQVSFEALGGETFNGTISEISPVLDTTSRTLAISLILNKEDSRIKVGMFSSIKLITQTSVNTLAVPTSAISTYYDDTIVYVVNEDNTVEKRIVQKGLLSDETVEIKTGLNEGELVVTQGLSSLSDGSTVRVVSN